MSFLAHALLHHAGMLNIWFVGVLNGQSFSSPFKQAELTIPTFESTQQLTVSQVAEFNNQLAQSYPTYYSFIAGNLNKFFFIMGVFFAVVFVIHIVQLFKCCKGSCKK
jgi:hypothetical protein